MSLIYLDHNASTPATPAVIDAVASTMAMDYANAASSDHVLGSRARDIVERARIEIAADLGARPADIIFTSGATEANSLAIRGLFLNRHADGFDEIVTCVTEHPSVIETLRSLVRDGAVLHVLGVDRSGCVDLDELKHLLCPKTALVTMMGANNETGVKHPIETISAMCADLSIPFHTDMTQLCAYSPIDLGSYGVTAASFSGHKLYGPKGIGLLYARSRRPRADLVPLTRGGGQERGLRGGTHNTEGIAGLAAAFLERRKNLPHVSAIEKRRDHLIEIISSVGGVTLNGSLAPRLPNTINLGIEGVDARALQYALRQRIAFSTASACSTEKVEASHVLLAMLGDAATVRNSFRLGLGFGTTDEDVTSAGNMIAQAASRLRDGRMQHPTAFETSTI